MNKLPTSGWRWVVLVFFFFRFQKAFDLFSMKDIQSKPTWPVNPRPMSCIWWFEFQPSFPLGIALSCEWLGRSKCVCDVLRKAAFVSGMERSWALSAKPEQSYTSRLKTYGKSDFTSPTKNWTPTSTMNMLKRIFLTNTLRQYFRSILISTTPSSSFKRRFMIPTLENLIPGSVCGGCWLPWTRKVCMAWTIWRKYTLPLTKAMPIHRA